jgi:hypothetical protein
MSKLTTVKNLLGRGWTGLKNLFKTKYHITIYRQSDSGSGAMYKSEYISRNITINRPKHLKFRDYETKNMVEIRSVKGLEVKIVEVD